MSLSIHEAVSKSTELDLMSWVMRAAPFHRQTCRHAHEAVSELHSGRLHGEELDSPFPYQWVVVAGSAADALSRSADRELADETHADEPTSAAEATDGAADSANGSDAPEDAASTEE